MPEVNEKLRLAVRVAVDEDVTRDVYWGVSRALHRGYRDVRDAVHWDVRVPVHEAVGDEVEDDA